MRRLVVKDACHGFILIDSVGTESVVEILARKYRELGGYIVSVMYP